MKQEEKEKRLKEEAEEERKLAQERATFQNQFQEELQTRLHKEVKVVFTSYKVNPVALVLGLGSSGLFYLFISEEQHLFPNTVEPR